MFHDPLLQSFLHQRGYDAPGTLGINIDPPILMIGDLDHAEDPDLEDMRHTPDQITLRVQLQSVPLSASLSAPSPTVQWIVDGQALQAVSLYALPSSGDLAHILSQHRAVHLIATGEGMYEQDGEQFPLSLSASPASVSSADQGTCPKLSINITPGQILCTRTYLTETEAHVQEIAPASDTLRRQLRPFGGFWNGSIDTEEQVYYEVSEVYPQRTRIDLVRQSQIHTGNYDVSTSEAGSLPLARTIRRGQLDLVLKMRAIENTTEPMEIAYHSFDYISKTPNLVDILYRRARS